MCPFRPTQAPDPHHRSWRACRYIGKRSRSTGPCKHMPLQHRQTAAVTGPLRAAASIGTKTVVWCPCACITAAGFPTAPCQPLIRPHLPSTYARHHAHRLHVGHRAHPSGSALIPMNLSVQCSHWCRMAQLRTVRKKRATVRQEFRQDFCFTPAGSEGARTAAASVLAVERAIVADWHTAQQSAQGSRQSLAAARAHAQPRSNDALGTRSAGDLVQGSAQSHGQRGYAYAASVLWDRVICNRQSQLGQQPRTSSRRNTHLHSAACEIPQ
jgi:hypothetical protein